jgi:hypothetical protein
MRRRARGEQLPKGDTWEHHAQGGKHFFWNRNALTARIHIGRRTWQWPLKVEAEEEAAAVMAPVRFARERLHQAAVEALNYELETKEAVTAAAALTSSRDQLASAIITAGGPKELADLVQKGPQEDVGAAVPGAQRPHVDREALTQKVAWLRTLAGERLKIAFSATAKEFGGDAADLAERLPKSAQRYLRKESARERWRDEARILLEQYPERSPKPLPVLFKGLQIDGLTREIFMDVISEVAATLLREKGFKTSWSEPGAPPRG